MRKTLLPILALTLAAPFTFAQGDPAEQTLLQLANQARAAHNLPPLHWDSELARAAHAHLERVVHEQGDHDTLMARQGLYARLFTMQAQGYSAVPATMTAADG